MYWVEGKTNIYRGKRRIVLWLKWTRSDAQIRDVSSSPRRRVMVTNTLVVVALICGPFSNTLGEAAINEGRMKGNKKRITNCNLVGTSANQDYSHAHL
jgi:hypothetical protein